MNNYKITYSKRRTIAIHIHKNGEVEVRAPKYITKEQINKFVESKADWIAKKIEEMHEIQGNKVVINEDKRIELIEKTKKIIPGKVEYYSKIMGVMPKKIKLGSAKSYWGFCSATNELNFSYRLMLASDATINYVVVHELAHIKQHNHSKKFWAEVEKIIPDYKLNKQELKILCKKYQ